MPPYRADWRDGNSRFAGGSQQWNNNSGTAETMSTPFIHLSLVSSCRSHLRVYRRLALIDERTRKPWPLPTVSRFDCNRRHNWIFCFVFDWCCRCCIRMVVVYELMDRRRPVSEIEWKTAERPAARQCDRAENAPRDYINSIGCG